MLFYGLARQIMLGEMYNLGDFWNVAMLLDGFEMYNLGMV